MGDRIVVMKDGWIQQVDTPQNIYNHPHNLFVAGFIGSPQMNFINGVIKKEGSRFAVNIGDNQIVLPEERNVSLANYQDKEIILGVRPETIQLSDDKDSGIRTRIDIIELMGSEMYLYCDLNGSKITVRTPVMENLKSDTTVNLTFNPNKLHLFDKETELAI